jgi:histidinol-phosphatase (PHP family)
MVAMLKRFMLTASLFFAFLLPILPQAIAENDGDANGRSVRVNYHGHTYRCGHAGTAQDEAYVTAAIRRGYTTIGFSDHVMLPWVTYKNTTRGVYRQAEEYIASIRALQNKYEGEIEILLGYEAEWHPLFNDYYRYLLDNGIIDYMILGNHQFDFDTLYNEFIVHDDTDSIEYVRAYVEHAILALDTGFFSVFAHPDPTTSWER